MEKRYVYMTKGQEYDPLADDSDSYGMVTRWYARDKYGVSVTWARTKKEAMDDARFMGYTVRR